MKMYQKIKNFVCGEDWRTGAGALCLTLFYISTQFSSISQIKLFLLIIFLTTIFLSFSAVSKNLGKKEQKIVWPRIFAVWLFLPVPFAVSEINFLSLPGYFIFYFSSLLLIFLSLKVLRYSEVEESKIRVIKSKLYNIWTAYPCSWGMFLVIVLVSGHFNCWNFKDGFICR